MKARLPTVVILYKSEGDRHDDSSMEETIAHSRTPPPPPPGKRLPCPNTLAIGNPWPLLRAEEGWVR